MKFFNSNHIKTSKVTAALPGDDDDGVFVDGLGGGQQQKQQRQRQRQQDGLRRRSMSGFSTDDDEAEAVISTDGMSAILHATTAVDSVGSDGSSVGDGDSSARFGSGSSGGSSSGFNTSSTHGNNSLLSGTDSKSHTTEGTTSTTTNDKKAGSIANAISKTETRRVVTVRIVIVTMLVLVAAGVSVGVYFIMKQSNENQFVLQFEGAASKVVEHFEEIMVEISSVSALAIAASAHSVDHDDAEWPYVSLSNFAERAGNARWSSKALQVSINPIVYSSQLDEWEQWVQLPENNYWM